MIYAAGFGKRLHPLTLGIPKPLIEVQGKPIVELIIDNLIAFGITDIIINTHHLHEKIEAFFDRKIFNASIRLIHEQQILGTGGGLYNTLDFWNDEDFFVCNADILCTANIREFIDQHRQLKSLVTLAVNRRKSPSMLLVDEEKRFVGLKRNGKQTIFQSPRGTIKAVGFCGLHLLSPKVFDYISAPVEFSIIDEYLKLLERQITIYTWDIGNAYWEDIGTKGALENASRQFPGFSYASS